ncbi:transposase [Actinomadura roseirufa]|uniref:transposase n=1 Tax=Actinomadura roseirufa TaxID=2094049 RepID=UPI0010413433
MLREVGSGNLAKKIVLVPKPYPPEFRRRALDLLESGRSVREVAASVGIAESCLHRWAAGPDRPWLEAAQPRTRTPSRAAALLGHRR